MKRKVFVLIITLSLVLTLLPVTVYTENRRIQRDDRCSTAAELTRLEIKTVYIVGGTGVISENVEKNLKILKFHL